MDEEEMKDTSGEEVKTMSLTLVQKANKIFLFQK
jgi:hypothetical protein